MRKKKAILNIGFSLILQFVTIISGFIVPRLIISTFGSDVNGLVNSITSFIGYISILQLGVGSVIKASLYKPLAKKDNESLSVIIRTTEKFFRKIAVISIVYILLLAVIFPTYIASDYEFLYSTSLVIVIGISTVAEYLLGITYQMLLEADQKSYIYSIIQISTVILNTICVVVLVSIGSSIQVVKLGSAVFFVLRPFIVSVYCKYAYNISTKVRIDNSVIAQRWDGFAQGIAYFIHSKTDIFVLTVFSSFSSISIYSVYALVTTGLNSFVTCIDKAVRSAFGNIIANEENENLIKTFNAYNTLMHILVTICFSTAAITVFKFVGVYVGGVSDASYLNESFGILIITAEMFYCLRMPYNSIIFAAGKFKETKKTAYIEACVNITLSCILVSKLGLTGVAIGTLIAMVYRSISFEIYLHNNILHFSNKSQLKRFGISLLSYIGTTLIGRQFELQIYSYFSWFVYAFLVCASVTILIISINIVFERENTIGAIKMLFRK